MFSPDEARALCAAIRVHIEQGYTVTDDALIDWKCARGMMSAAHMANAKIRRLWLREARELVNIIKMIHDHSTKPTATNNL